jgi:hypothetical protein
MNSVVSEGRYLSAYGTVYYGTIEKYIDRYMYGRHQGRNK